MFASGKAVRVQIYESGCTPGGVAVVVDQSGTDGLGEVRGADDVAGGLQFRRKAFVQGPLFAPRQHLEGELQALR